MKKTKKRLTSSELMKINLNDRDRQLMQSDHTNLLLSLRISKLSQQVYILKSKLCEDEEKDINFKIAEKCDIIASKERSRDEFVSSIKKRLNLKSMWGFNPKTGEVRED